MKNYKVKASDLYIGMDFYHVENSGAYSGGEVIINISKIPNMEFKDEIGAKYAGSIQVDTCYKHGNGTHFLKSDDIVYPVIETKDVTIFTKIKWRIRQLYYLIIKHY